MWTGRHRTTPIGLDIGGRYVKAAQMTSSGRGDRSWDLTACVSLPRVTPNAPMDEAEAARLAEVLGRQNFTGRSVVLSAPAGEVLASLLDLPPADSGAPLNQIAQVELAAQHRTDERSIQAAFWHLPGSGRGGGGGKAMAVGIACDHAEALVDLFERVGLTVKALDVHALAVARVCELIPDLDPTGIVAAIDLGWNAAQLVLLHQNTVVYERALADGGMAGLYAALIDQHDVASDVVDYLLGEMGLRDDDGETQQWAQLPTVRHAITAHFEAILREVGISFTYVEHQYPDAPVTRLIFLGGGASIPGLAERVSQWLHVPTQTLTPHAVARCPRSMMDMPFAASALPAMGLALNRQE